MDKVDWIDTTPLKKFFFFSSNLLLIYGNDLPRFLKCRGGCAHTHALGPPGRSFEDGDGNDQGKEDKRKRNVKFARIIT